jgi:putative FmdB family regulatory protein
MVLEFPAFAPIYGPITYNCAAQSRNTSMPIYEYQCKSCEHKLEKIQRLSDPLLTDCPNCNKAELRRLISAAGFRLKGAGWYETDFKKSNQRNLAESSDGTGNGASQSDSSKGKGDSAGKPASADKGDASAKKTSSEPAKSSSTAKSTSDSA